MKNVVLLGSTGSIGTSTAMVAGDLPDDIRLVGLAAGSNTELLAKQSKQFRPELVSIGSPEKAAELRPQLDGIRVASGDEGLIELATLPSADIVLIDGTPWTNIKDVYKVSQVLIDGKLAFGAGAPALPAANQTDRLPSISVPALIDDFERDDRRSSIDTLRVDTPDGGIDRSVEITQTVPREDGGKALSLSARMAVKEAAYAGFAIPLSRGSITPAKISGYKGVRFDLKGDGPYTIRLNGLDGVWEASVQGADGWSTVELPFAQFKPVERRGKVGPAFTGDGITQVEFGGSRGPGKRMWLQVDNVRFY